VTQSFFTVRTANRPLNDGKLAAVEMDSQIAPLLRLRKLKLDEPVALMIQLTSLKIRHGQSVLKFRLEQQ
jgi:hypothetical protein